MSQGGLRSFLAGSGICWEYHVDTINTSSIREYILVLVYNKHHLLPPSFVSKHYLDATFQPPVVSDWHVMFTLRSPFDTPYLRLVLTEAASIHSSIHPSMFF